MTDTPFEIYTQSGFEPVADVFRAHFKDGQDVGAQFSVIQDGETLVKMNGGWADDARITPVTDETLISVYSSGKAAAALVIAWLAERDRLGYNQRVSSLWPEFAAHGKGDLTIAEVLSHQAGLSGITNPDWTREDWFDWDKTCAQIAGQEPLFPPGSASGYHPITYGFLAGEIARRADAQGRMLGVILREEFGNDHDLDVYIGLPEDQHHRCADMIKPKTMAKFGEKNPAVIAAFFQKYSSAGGTDITRWRKAELAGSNCQASAHGLAALMQCFNDGTIGGQHYLSEDTRIAARQPRVTGRNLVLPFDLTFAAGVMHNDPNYYFGPNGDTIGHSGWGGSCVFADQQTGLSGAYAMTRQDGSLLGDPRSVALINAVYACL